MRWDVAASDGGVCNATLPMGLEPRRQWLLDRLELTCSCNDGDVD